MKVKIIQSHRKLSPNGVQVEYRVGQVIEIDMADFSSNLHETVTVEPSGPIGRRRSKPYIDDNPNLAELGEDPEEPPGTDLKTSKAGGLAPKDKEK